MNTPYGELTRIVIHQCHGQTTMYLTLFSDGGSRGETEVEITLVSQRAVT